MSAAASRVATHGVVFIHSAPTALCPHIVWAMEGVLGAAVHLEWTPQPAVARLVRAELSWTGEPGTGARLATALRGCVNLRFEVTEAPSRDVDGSRWSYTPTLGVHHTWTSVGGDAVVNEDRLRSALDAHRGDSAALAAAIDEMLGAPWDRELDPFRYAGEGAPVRWLHKVG
jgi:hypothetical protein